ncbi:MAG: preprotein translocase subunit SecG [Smithellaceae bacterium]|jgi:preprotein translocase subunit SecG|nr:preprotein translocase subunit SecG [Smithellaceae bacterium]
MTVFLTILHIVVCITLILIVLLQSGKGANMGAAFGGSSQTVFGSGGAGTFLGKMTAAVAIIFMLTSFTLTYTASRKPSGVMDNVSAPVSRQAAPVAPKPATLPSAPAAPAPSPGAAQAPAAVPAPAAK